jgi:hypothetical protein
MRRAQADTVGTLVAPNDTSLKKVPMITNRANTKTPDHTNDLSRAAERRRRRVQVRRVAVISPERAHFKLRPIRGSLGAT